MNDKDLVQAGKNAEELKAEEAEKRQLTEQYRCTGYCRCCPFPGLKCVMDGHPAK